MNYLKKAREIIHQEQQSEIKTMLMFGELLVKYMNDGHPRKCKNHAYFASELAKEGEHYTIEYFEACQLLTEKFPLQHLRMTEIGMTKTVAMRACHWTPEAMAERLDEVERVGWSRIVEKYIMRKNGPKKAVEMKQAKLFTPYNHRAHAVVNGEEENFNLISVKKNGEWVPEKIVNLLAHWYRSVPDFMRLVDEAKRLAGSRQDCGTARGKDRV